MVKVYNLERLRHEDYCEFKASLKMGRKGGEGKKNIEGREGMGERKETGKGGERRRKDSCEKRLPGCSV